jgi:hypothetical protein
MVEDCGKALRIEYDGAPFTTSPPLATIAKQSSRTMAIDSFFLYPGSGHKLFHFIRYAYRLMNQPLSLGYRNTRRQFPSCMRQLNGVYIKAFNKRHGRVGHVFQAV